MADFYIDSNVAIEVADLLKLAGHSAVTARDLDREADTDDEHLLVASRQDRIFVTHNERDFILLHDAWDRWSKAWHVAEYHAGVLVVLQGRRYGIEWDAIQIARAIIFCAQECSPVAGQLLRYKEAGWQRRWGRDWLPCT